VKAEVAVPELSNRAGPVSGPELPIVQALLSTVVEPNATGMTCIGAAAREARILVGRNPESGCVMEPEHQKTWAGALVYFVLLEQLGSCFKPSGSAVPTQSALKNALIWFADVTGSDAAVVYNLRNRFAHDYSLDSPKPGRARYIVHAQEARPFVEHVRNSDYSVSLIGLARAAEMALAKVRSLAERGQLEIHHPGGLGRVLQRFTARFAVVV
jgi:hypothetical protein